MNPLKNNLSANRQSNKTTGNVGEIIAGKYLEKNGYEILEKNYYSRDGEIDLICKKGNELIFVEVKTRKNIRFGFPEESITNKKQMNLAKTAEKFLNQSGYKYGAIRVDAVSIIIEKNRHAKIKHFKNIVQDLTIDSETSR